MRYRVEGQRKKSVGGATESYELSRVVTAESEKEAFFEAERLYREESEELLGWEFVWEEVTEE